jgi:hypothetical protein
MEKLHVLALRNLFKRVHECQVEEGGHATQLRLAAVAAVCARLGVAADIDEAGPLACMRIVARRLVLNVHLNLACTVRRPCRCRRCGAQLTRGSPP